MNGPSGDDHKSPDTKEVKSVSEVELLRQQVEQLKALLDRQQTSIAEMKARLDLIQPGSKVQQSSGPSPAEAGRVSNLAAVPASSEPGAPTEASSPPASVSAPGSEKGTKQETTGITAGWNGEHAFLRTLDGSFMTSLAGYTQLDFRGYGSGVHPPDTFLIRRARLWLEGKLFRYFDYKVEGDFADTTSTLLRDGYVRLHRIDELQFTAGQFKEPFSQEEMRLDLYQDFVERSMANSLAPSRSPGIMLSGQIDGGVFEYQIGAFNGKGLLVNNNNGTPETAVRLRFTPGKRSSTFWLKGLTFGGAYAQGRNAGGNSIAGVTESHSFTFFSPDTIKGKVIRANGEVTWLLGPAAFRAEYDQVNQARDALGARFTNLPGVVSKAYVAEFTYLLAGEEKPGAGIVVPKRNAFSGQSGKFGLGAWELKARLSSLQISDGTSKFNRAESIYFGANWYLNRFVRYLFDAGIERFNDPLRSPSPLNKNYFVLASQIQFAF